MPYTPSIALLEDLSPEQFQSLELHSVLNILNVLSLQLGVLGFEEEPLGKMRGVMDAMDRFAAAIRTQDVDAFSPAAVEDFQNQVWAVFAEIEEGEGHGERMGDLSDTRELFEEIFDVMNARASELALHRKAPWAYQRFSIDELRDDFDRFFSAVEKNSHGRFGITRNIARQDDATYLIPFEIESDNGDHIEIPLEFKDVLRDLIANARKYTAPGGIIHAGIHDNGQHITFTVKDNGRGIPEDEIPRVFEYGFRARNAQDRPSMGGGFGLTKALYVTHHLNGHLEILSRLGLGTTVKAVIPSAARKD